MTFFIYVVYASASLTTIFVLAEKCASFYFTIQINNTFSFIVVDILTWFNVYVNHVNVISNIIIYLY